MSYVDDIAHHGFAILPEFLGSETISRVFKILMASKYASTLLLSIQLLAMNICDKKTCPLVSNAEPRILIGDLDF